MSAIRNSQNRSQTRKKRTAPYARGLFGTFARFFGFGGDDQTEEISEFNGSIGNGNGAATGLSLNGHAHKPQYNPGNRSPLKPSMAGNGSTFTLSESPPAAAVPNSEQVANFFSQRMGTNVSANEVESMVSNLQTTQEPERFRFTFTTPGRDSPPSAPSPGTDSAFSSNPTPSRKKLTKNPNGVYRWEGAGSAKQARQRNRFGSPAFVASSRADRPSLTVPAETPASDNKRRKVTEDASGNARPSGSGSAPNGSVPFPVTSPTTPRSNGVQRQTSPLPSSRLRTPAKPTAPVNPSPLRQAWSDGSSSSSREGDRTSPSLPTKSSKTATFVADLIKETAPPNKPDLSNPYQSASPVGKVGPPRRSVKRPRATGRPAPASKEQKEEEEKRKADEQKKKDEEERMKSMSAQAIIEATVPKGSKRSRPPAHLDGKSAGESSRFSPPQIEAMLTPAKIEYVVEEVQDYTEEDKRSSKRSKPMMAGRGLPSSLGKAAGPDVTVEEIEDVEMQGREKEPATEQPKVNGSRNAQFAGFKTTSIPREPSKLRFSIQPESASPSPASTPAPTPTLPESNSAKSTPPPIQDLSKGFGFSFAPPLPPTATNPVTTPKYVENTTPTSAATDAVKPVQQSAEAVKAQVQALDVKSLPAFSFTFTTTSLLPTSVDHVKARDAVKAISATSLPKFDFNSVNAVASSSTVSSASASTSSTSAAPIKGFDFAAAGMKAPSANKDTWQCGVCMLSNPLSASKCTTCDEPKSGAASTSSTPSNSSSFSGSASKPAATSITLTSSGSAPQPAAQGFNWAAAGMKAPATNPDSWKCDTCGLMSPKGAPQCTTCDEPAPASVGAAVSSSTTTTAPSNIFGGSSTGGGFKPSGLSLPSGGFGLPASNSPTSSGSKPSGFTPSSTGFKTLGLPRSSGSTSSGFKTTGSTASSSGFTLSGFTPSFNTASSSAKPSGFTPAFGSFGSSSSTPAASNPFASTAPSSAPKDSASPSSSSAVVKGFDFAAAGMKPPTQAKDAWACSLCGLSNPSAATSCQTCEQPR
ncbi:hypothetical protein CPB83DRAFT_848625 [Crepidotus variabilis]|uniref:RanBP2-type domain-containing protein n=1 Tax=Crepidotus variabilis TaxID=179855 RepID=A0A9P6EM96_9AGAR|nr:hypothetical protein CPB83DRAFT_848625 [Crepidotus variabilis]